jgi:actin-like protein 6A
VQPAFADVAVTNASLHRGVHTRWPHAHARTLLIPLHIVSNGIALCLPCIRCVQYLLSKKIDSSNRLSVTTLNFPLTHPSYHSMMVRDLYRDMKESLCRLGESTFDHSQKFPTVAYELPDGNSIEVGNERFTVPEHIFNPKYSGLLELKHDFDGFVYRGLQHMVYDSVESVDVDLRKELYGNIVLSGGNTLFPGTPNRLTKEVGNILSTAHKVKVVGGSSLNDRRFGVWIGGSILASLGTFHQMWISKAEYEEQGATVLAAKCP